MKNQLILFKTLGQNIKKIDSSLLEQILGANSLISDLEQNNDILKQLVCDYAALEKTNFRLLEELKNKHRTINEDLLAAGEIQKSLLPAQRPALPGYNITWDCIQCEQIGGDLLNIFPYDDENWIFYIFDVSGHGPRAAMITVALAQFLNPHGPSSHSRDFLSPSSILAELELEFPFERFKSFFSIVYGVLHHKSGRCRFCNSAHPYPILADAENVLVSEESNPMLGLKLASEWQETFVDLNPGQKLLLYTDGVVECRSSDNEMFGENRLGKTFLDLCRKNNANLLERLNQEVSGFCSGRPFADDYSLLLIERQPLDV